MSSDGLGIYAIIVKLKLDDFIERIGAMHIHEVMYSRESINQLGLCED